MRAVTERKNFVPQGLKTDLPKVIEFGFGVRSLFLVQDKEPLGSSFVLSFVFRQKRWNFPYIIYMSCGAV